jgi:hypothetical protein
VIVWKAIEVVLGIAVEAPLRSLSMAYLLGFLLARRR